MPDIQKKASEAPCRSIGGQIPSPLDPLLFDDFGDNAIRWCCRHVHHKFLLMSMGDMSDQVVSIKMEGFYWRERNFSDYIRVYLILDGSSLEILITY